MKKVTILLVIIMFAAFGIRCFVEMRFPHKDATASGIISIEPVIMTNRLLEKYSGKKISGYDVLALFDFVETCNIESTFPTNLRYADVLPNSYNWTTVSSTYITSRDKIVEDSFYEVVVQDQLPSNALDGYYDTITIRPYDVEYILTPAESLFSGE